jgi:hypothetical protein
MSVSGFSPNSLHFELCQCRFLAIAQFPTQCLRVHGRHGLQWDRGFRQIGTLYICPDEATLVKREAWLPYAKQYGLDTGLRQLFRSSLFDGPGLRNARHAHFASQLLCCQAESLGEGREGELNIGELFYSHIGGHAHRGDLNDLG